MLNREDNPLPPFTDRELGLIANSIKLREALRATINYVEAGLQPVLPPTIEKYRELLLEAPPEMDVGAVSPHELFEVVTAMGRFLSQTSSAEIFARHGLTGLPDWIVLMTVAMEPPGMTDRQITRIMGANYKRIQRLVQTLAETGLVRLTPIGAKGASTVEITASGRARLEGTNAALEPLLKWFTQRHRFRLLFVGRHIRALSRMHDDRSVNKRRMRPPA